MNKATGFAALILLVLGGCGTGPESPRGFSLPEGDTAAGEQAFVRHQCLACHTLEGFENQAEQLEQEMQIKLGGESPRVTTYAELVTSIINPSHKITRAYKQHTTNGSGQSKMRNYNDVLTVTELVDLVSFLQPHYKVKPITYTHYGQYHVP